MSENIPNLENLKFDREPGFLSVFDPDRFKAFGLTPLTDLRAKYQTPEAMKAGVDGLKNNLDKLTKNQLIIKAEIGGILILALQSTLTGAKTKLAERVFGLNSNTGYLYIDLYKYLPWGYNAARDAAIADAESEGGEPSEVSIKTIIEHGKAEAIKAGAVETVTFTGGDVLIIDSSLPPDERINMAIIPRNFANRKGSKEGFWVNVLPGLVPTGNRELRPEYVWQEMNGSRRPYFTFGDVGYETRLVIARIDKKAQKIWANHPEIEDVEALVNFKARKPQTVNLPLIVPSERRVIWADHSDAALDPDICEIRELGDPVAGVIAFQPKRAKRDGFCDLGGQRLTGDWVLASLRDEGILIRPAIVNYSLIGSDYVTWTSADALAKLQTEPAPDNGERWDALDAESIKSEFGMGESALLSKLRMADLIDGWKATAPTDRAIDEGYARHKNNEVEWNIGKLHQELIRVDGFAALSLNATWQPAYLRSLGLLSDSNKTTQKAVDDGLALTVGNEIIHTDKTNALLITDESRAFMAEWDQARAKAAETADQKDPLPDGARDYDWHDSDWYDLRRYLSLLGYLDTSNNKPTQKAITEGLAVAHGDSFVWFDDPVEHRLDQPDADIDDFDFVDIGPWLAFMVSVGLADEDGRGTAKAVAEGLVCAVDDEHWHGTRLRDRMIKPDAVAFLTKKPVDGGTATGTTEGDPDQKTPSTGQENGEEDLAEPVQVVPFKIRTTEADAPDSPAKIAENLVASLGRIESLAIQLRTLAPSARTTAVITRKIEAHAKDAAEMFKQLLTHLNVSIEDEHAERSV